MKKDLKYYLKLNYDISIHKFSKEEGGGYSASIPLLGESAFVAEGDTIEDALSNLELVKKDILKIMLNSGTSIEEPKVEDDLSYSGKFIVRVPKELHKKLAQSAKEQNISLNLFINYLLSTNLETDIIIKKIQKHLSHTIDELKHEITFNENDKISLSYIPNSNDSFTKAS